MNGVAAWLGGMIKRPLFIFLTVATIYSIDRHHRLEHNVSPGSPFYSDVYEYYRILPDYFINHGVTTHAFYKTTMGMAIMYAPAFFVADVIAQTCDYPRTGYSEPYQRATRILSIVYSLIGLLVCGMALNYFFSGWVTVLTLATILFATNYYYYTYGWGEYPHVYLFMLFSVVALLSLRWIIDRKPGSLLGIGFTIGFIALIRPTDAIVALFPLLLGIGSAGGLITRARQFLMSGKYFVGAILLFCLPIAVQLAFWKIRTGNFFYWSYIGERFFFDDPQLINFLFSYRKGWLVYTPVMFLSLIGIVLLYKRRRGLFLPVVLIVGITIYLLSCWWEWSFGGSFGCRALVQYYAVLAFPLACFYESTLNRPRHGTIKVIVISFLVVCTALNLHQTMLYRTSVIHWSGMNREAYWYIMRRDTFTTRDYQHLDSIFRSPDPEAMLKGRRDM